MDNWRLHIPEGTQDYLIDECYAKKELEHELRCLFQRWGYRQVETPVYEYYDVFADSNRYQYQEEILKFVDRNGRIVALRPDMTTPVARLVCTKMGSNLLPLRLCYIADVFRYSDLQMNRQRQFTQAGVELIGSSSPLADAEIIALAISALQHAGMKDFHVVIGQVEVFKAIIAETGLDREQVHWLSQLIDQKNAIAIEDFLNNLDVSEDKKKAILKLPQWFGGLEVIENIRHLMNQPSLTAALDNICEVYDTLKRWGMEEYISVDLGMIPSLDYYTGVIFSIFVPWLGYPVCSGGRYNHLLSQFGSNLPATGFAIGIKRLMMALDKQGSLKPAPLPFCLIVYTRSRAEDAFREAQRLRDSGFDVQMELLDTIGENPEKYAAERGIKRVLYYCEGE